MNRITTRLCAIAVSSGMLASPVAFAQTLNPPSLLQQGVGAAMYGRCQTDALDPDRIRSAAVLATFSPAVVDRLVPSPDEIGEVAVMCSQQIHQQRCSAKIVAVAGDVLMSQQPAGKAVPPSANPGSILGGTVGAVTGLLLGTNESVGTGVGAAVIGGYLGAKGGSAVWDKARMKSCIERQVQLDGLSSKLQGYVSVLSVASLTSLIEANIRARTLTSQEAQLLVSEANKLADRAVEVLQAAR